MPLTLIFAVAATMATTSAATEPKPTNAPAASAAPAQPVKTAEADPVICHDVQVTGSHFSERQCLHKSEWQEMDKQNEGDNDQISRRINEHSINPNPHD